MAATLTIEKGGTIDPAIIYVTTITEESMLILTRRVAESIHVGDSIRVTVLDVQDGQVRLGINAPKEIPVHREEIYYRIKYENEAKNLDNGPNDGEEYPVDDDIGNR